MVNVAINATSGATGPENAEVMEIIREERSMLQEQEEEEEDSQQAAVHLNNNKDVFVNDLVEVNEHYEFSDSYNITKVKGRPRKNIQFFENIGASKFIFEVIRNGYKLPFVRLPHSKYYQTTGQL